MKRVKYVIIIILLELSVNTVSSQTHGFSNRGLYLHEGWFFNYPFAIKSWARQDYANMFNLLHSMGYNQVAVWPMLESIPMPLSKTDEMAIRQFRKTIEDAHAAAMEFWLVQNPNLTTPLSIATKPWKQRNPYPVLIQVRLDSVAQAEPYLAHRSAMMAILNNADAYVTIDGDPGG